MYQQQPSFWEGLINGFMSQREKNQEQQKQANMYLDASKFGETLNNLDYGGQTSIQDLANRSNQNSNYTNKTAEVKAQQGLLPTGFNQQIPTSSNIGQGLLGQPLQQAQQPTNFNISNPLDKYSATNNPANVTVSAPKNIQQQTSMIKSQIPLAMKELLAKGYNPKDVLPLLQQVANDKISEHTATYQQQMVNDLYQGFVNEENPNKKAMYAARLKQAGYDVTTPYKEFAPEYKFEKFDNGGTNEGYAFNPKTGKVEKQLSIDKTVSPDAQLNADTRIKTTGMNSATALQVASMRGSSGGRSSSGNGRNGTEKINGMTNLQINNEISKYKQWQAKNPDLTIDDYPRQAQYEDAADPYGNFRSADQQIKEIYQEHPDATPEEIFQFLNDRLQRG